MEARLVDDAGRDVKTGARGEIWLRGPALLKEYWRNPEATRESFDPEGWFKTGDVAHCDDEGFYFVDDRKKDMIISGGENIYPAEIENVLMGHPAVVDCAVIGVPSERWGETVKALVVAAPEARPEAKELVDYCRERLAHYKCPTSVDWLERIPRNPSGKILKTELREPYWKGEQRFVR
jgi:acyl-CoA synthetase (AMP-forming)/AMP-acid ligase II